MQHSMRATKRYCHAFSFKRFLVLVAFLSLAMFSSLFVMVNRNEFQCMIMSTSPRPTEEFSCDRCIVETPAAVTLNEEILEMKKLKHARWDYSRTYKVYDFVHVGDDFESLTSSYKVSLASQTSIERLVEFLPGATHWTGPISLAVFVVGEEFIQLKGFIAWLFVCRPEIYHKIALHIVMPKDQVGIDGDVPEWAKDCEAKPLPPGTRSPEILAWKMKNVYPQNHLRNVARKNCGTPYVFLVDIDIVPSISMAASLDRFLRTKATCAKCAYVIPTYELDFKVSEFPRNKSALLKLVNKGQALPFHNKVFLYNSYASNFTRWQNTKKESSEVHVSHAVTNYEFFYEPFYVALDNAPPHDERFVGYGFTRNTQFRGRRIPRLMMEARVPVVPQWLCRLSYGSALTNNMFCGGHFLIGGVSSCQVYEMYLSGYEFKVLSPTFTIHWGLQKKKKRPQWREKQNYVNGKLFETFKRELFARYRKDPLHLIRRPVFKTSKKI